MNISEYQQCANCGACYNVCPTGAITVKTNTLFYTPTVDNDLCVNCSRCVNVCPVNQEVAGNTPIFACAGWHREEEVVLKSSSGGAFWGLAQGILAQGGVVYGAVLAEDGKSVLFASSDEVPLQKMLKSKYAESSVGLSFQKIRDTLSEGRKVLFCGTPCQVAGLLGYLGKDDENLFTCDFACGGLPSHAIYRDYIEALEKKYGAKVENVDFRPKTHGWKRYALKIKFQNGREYLRLGTEDAYLRSFLYGKYTVRDYCLECKFPECHMSDITLADFWRYREISSLRNDDGISLILCNTTKGKNLIDSVKEKYELSEMELAAASYNNHVSGSENKRNRHDAFLKLCEKEGFSSACRQYLPLSFSSACKAFLTRKLRYKRRDL